MPLPPRATAPRRGHFERAALLIARRGAPAEYKVLRMRFCAFALLRFWQSGTWRPEHAGRLGGRAGGGQHGRPDRGREG